MSEVNAHIGDLLSAYADDQLEADEKATVEAHLVTCETCQEELQEVREAQAMLSPLPLLVPPTGFFFAGFTSMNKSRRWIVVSMVTLVLAGIVAFVVYPNRSDFEIKSEDLVMKHMAWVEDGANAAEIEEPHPYDLPSDLADYQPRSHWRRVTFGNANAIHLHYTNGRRHLSVFEHEGEYPETGVDEPVSVRFGQHRAEYFDAGQAKEISWRSGPVVITLVSTDMSRDALADLANKFEELPRPSSEQELRHSCRQILQTLAGD